ncbi:hypothetical protein BMF94_0732 [Rhodotorula taiwanensis]|uniref:Uncharacterized protein n=1 Tax=Rhodotorula taiwanensis TaxID=741276 RepID=A0A2S5BGV6_9BASI|nr:hypothetical protein BMF94_0732 [Rhodotorula taiwanensis]
MSVVVEPIRPFTSSSPPSSSFARSHSRSAFYAAPAGIMASDSAAPPQQQQHHHFPTSHAPQPSPSSAAVDEDDLLALLNNDLAIDSKRDRELVVLSSFLKGVLPPAAGAVAHPLPPNLTSNVTIGNAATAQHYGGWNGWRPTGEGIAAPFGSPMSFASTSSAMSGMPPGPSTSFGSAFSPSSIPSSHPFASPKNHFIAGSPAAAAQRSPFGRPGIAQQAMPPGARAPACSRERVPTLASFSDQNRAAAAPPVVSQPEEGGWKGRLRSSKARQPSADRGRPVAPTVEEDVMME